MELWDLYRKDGTPAGCELVRGQPMPKGLFHIVSGVVVRHVDGSYLLMQRDLHKDGWPGLWEMGASGSILKGETPLQGAIRELKEECGLDGKIVRPLAVQYKAEGNAEYSFEVAVSEEQEPITGYDPEETGDNPPLKEVLWMRLDEISEKDRAFLWSYGLISVGEFFEVLKSWGNDISYPSVK